MSGGPSTSTMRMIEGGLQDSYKPAVLARLEDVLRWRRGSVRAVLAGGDPVALEEEAVVPRRPAAPRPAPRLVPGPEHSVREALWAALAAVNAPLRELVLAEARGGLLSDPFELMIWETAGWSEALRAEEIANLRARRAASGAGPSASAAG
jgi:hypothetical protein